METKGVYLRAAGFEHFLQLPSVGSKPGRPCAGYFRAVVARKTKIWEIKIEDILFIFSPKWHDAIWVAFSGRMHCAPSLTA
jgi:hypothetical protein